MIATILIVFCFFDVLLPKTTLQSQAEWITPRHVNIAVGNDEELSRLLQKRVGIMDGGVLQNIHSSMKFGITENDYGAVYVHGAPQEGVASKERLNEMLQCAMLSVEAQETLLATTTGSHAGSATSRDSIQGINNSILSALAARAGCLALTTPVFDEIRGIIKVYLERLLKDAITIAEHGKRKRVLATDVLVASADQSSRNSTLIKVLCGTGQCLEITVQTTTRPTVQHKCNALSKVVLMGLPVSSQGRQLNVLSLIC